MGLLWLFPVSSSYSLPLFTTNARNNQLIHKSNARQSRLEHLTSQSDLNSTERLELTGLRARGDTYNSSLFTETHVHFKNLHNTIFSTLTNIDDTLFYLDGPQSTTTRHLLATGYDNDKLYTANYFGETVAELKRLIPNVFEGSASEVLKSLDVNFDGYYLDSCTGSTSKIIEILNTITFNKPRTVLGITLTNSSPDGSSIINRVIELNQWLYSQDGVKVESVCDEPRRWGVEGEVKFEDEGVVVLWWVVLNKDDNRT
ncbi:hypothetical protein TL16_g12071 [Triparma laevis f. inornata]|uniref:Uncharacterized protein n=1 Tax=Triparma laevis f. inornata TaxID=1714386 RepID=A0A9W7BJD9_9STRA|nr:hypothetical protein TL16_g12071 [Triparma laevis f. inornata]